MAYCAISVRESFCTKNGRVSSSRAGKRATHAPDSTKRLIDKADICPCCFSRVALQDGDRVVIMGQSYHFSELLGQSQRIKPSKDLLKELKELYLDFLSKDESDLSAEQIDAKDKLKRIFPKVKLK